MKQHVDLYKEGFRGGPPLLGSSHLLLLVAGLAALLGVVYGGLRIAVWQDGRQLVKLREVQAEAADRVVELARTHPVANPDATLEAAVASLDDERAAKTGLLRLLSGQTFGNRQGFSPHVTALARRPLDGLWLREIHLSEGGSQVALVGRAVAPELLPRWIQGLREEAAFAGRAFAAFRLERSEAFGPLDFRLATAQEVTP